MEEDVSSGYDRSGRIGGKVGVFDITGRFLGRDSTAIRKPGVYIIRGENGSHKFFIVR